MVILRFLGGLGNQMFQYALYKKLEHAGKDVYADLTWYQNNERVKFYLYDFNIKFKIASEKDIKRLSDYSNNMIDRARRKLFGLKKSHILEEYNSYYNPNILTCENAYLDGYWQTEKYFFGIESELSEAFHFNLNDERTTIWKEKIVNENSVSIHIRRKDYLDEKNIGLYGGICTNNYYFKAIEYMNKAESNVSYYIFTDDPEWISPQITMPGFSLVANQGSDYTISDMYLISLCKHNIIANSSFSWWGAWLNKNKFKKVIAPSKWLNTEPTPDIWCRNWIKC